MDVSVKTIGSLGRRLKVIVPSAEVEKRVSARLQKMIKTVRLDGFRPGKVPVKVIQERFGQSVFHEVASEVIESSYHKAVGDHKLTPAGQPDFKDTVILPGEDIQFTAEIELYPEFELAPLAKEKVEKPVSEVQGSDIDDMIDHLRLRNAEWRVVERPCKDGDRVRVHFEEKVEIFNTDDSDELVVTLGGAATEGDFGSQLLKSRPGDSRKIKLKFPKDHPRTELAGKKFKFKVTVREIQESVLPPVDEKFLEQCGVKEGGIDALREMLKEGMKYELKNKLEGSFKKNVMDLLIRKNEIEVPQVMVRREIERMRKDMAERSGRDAESFSALGDELFKEQATRHVKLGLIMGKIAESNGLEVSEQEFEAQLDQTVAAYEDADAVKQHYRHDRQARSALLAMTLEGKVFQWVITQLQVQEKTREFSDVMQH